MSPITSEILSIHSSKSSETESMRQNRCVWVVVSDIKLIKEKHRNSAGGTSEAVLIIR
jgi:hypothetical protein